MAAIGAVHVDVVPSTESFVREMRDKVLAGADALGRELGQKLGRSAAGALGQEITDGINDGLNNRRAESTAARRGKATGSAFGRALKAEIEKAIYSLPEIDLEADISDVERSIGEVRASLDELRDKRIGIDIGAGDALAEVTALREELQAIADDQTVDIDVRYDTKTAADALGKLQRQIANDVGGSFDRTLRQSLDSAISKLPKIDLSADSSPVERTLAELRSEIEAFGDQVAIDINIDGADALAQVESFRAALQVLVDDETVDVKVRTDAAAALKDLGAIAAAVAALDNTDVEIDVEIRTPSLGAFRTELAAAIRAASESLPEIQIDADSSLTTRKIAKLRAELATLSEQVTLGLDDDAALAKLARIRDALRTLSNAHIGLELDSDIETALARVRAAVEEAGQRDGDAFGSRFKTALRASLANLPNVKLEGDPTDAERAIEQIRKQLASLADKRIGIDIDAAQAVAKVESLQALLASIAEDTTDLRLQLDTAEAAAELQAFIAAIRGETVEVNTEIKPPELGAFLTRVKAELEKARLTLPDIEVNADTGPALREIAALKATVSTITGNINIDTDVPATLAELATVKAAALELSRTTVDIKIKTDIAAFLAQVAVAEAALRGIAAESDNVATRMARWRLILALVVALLPLIAGALLGISAALLLIIAPILAIAAGLDGIKKAAAPLKDEMRAIQTAASQAFEQNLGPAISNIERLLTVLRPSIAQTAIQLSDMATRVTALVTSGANLDRLTRTFSQINVVIDALTPAVATFIENFIKLGDVGSAAMVSFGAQLSQVAADFGAMIDRLSATGTAQAAIQALFQVLSSILGLIGPLSELGAVMLAAFGPAIAAAINAVGAVLTAIAVVVDSLPGPFATLVTVLILMRTIMLVLGTTLPTVAAGFARFGAAGAIAGTALTGFGARISLLLAQLAALGPVGAAAAGGIRLVGGALLTAFGGGIGLLIAAVIIGLSLLGNAQADSAAAAEAHKQAVQQLADALRNSGGAIDSNIIKLTQEKLANSEAADAAKTLGISQLEVANAIAQGGPVYDSLREKLQAVADQQIIYTRGSVGLNQANQEAKDSARVLLDQMGLLRGEFVSAGEANRQLAAALHITGSSLVGGLNNAVSLEGALSTLRDTSEDTADKVKALKEALDALDGGTLTAEEAAQKLNDSIRDIGKAFTEATGGSKAAAAALITTSGAINTTTEKGSALFEAVTKVRDSMLESATATFDAAGGLSNVGAASEAAGAKVQLARDAFIKSAQAAGLGATAAANLADHYGLIPSLVTTLLEAKGIPQVNQELGQLSALINNQIPGTKSITIDALSEPARKVLDALGIQVKTLPDGKVQVSINDQTGPALAGVLKSITSSSPEVPVGANVTPFKSTIDNQIAALQAQKRELPVQAHMERQEIDTQIGALIAQRNTLNFDANTATVLQQLEEVKAQINTSVGTITIDGNKLLATDALAAVLTAIAQGKASVNIDGNKVPVSAALSQVLGQIATSNASVTINGVDIPARDVLRATLAAIAAGKANVTLGGVDVPARDVLARLLGTIGLSKESVTALLNDAGARAQLAELTRPRSMTINVSYSSPVVTREAHGGAIGGIVKAYRDGGIEPFATGGVRLRPMRGGLAQKVAPNSWRVIGDRVRDDEAYIPINNSARSHALLDYTANAMGRDLAPQATGSLLGTLQATANLAARLRKAAITTQTAGSFTATASAAGSGGTFAGSSLGGDTKALEAKLDQIAGLLAKGGQGSSITVEDKSGDPVATARSVALAIRLAR